MKICGVELKGSEAVFAVVSDEGGTLAHVPLAIKKLAMADDDEAGNVRAFATQLEAFMHEHGIVHIALKKRGKKGDFAGGATTFKMEAILQLLPRCEVQLLAAQTITAQERKRPFELPAALNKYQHEAYRTACAALIKAAA
jgi:hypothetical protein